MTFEIPLGLQTKESSISNSSNYICITAIVDTEESHYPCDHNMLSRGLKMLMNSSISMLHPRPMEVLMTTAVAQGSFQID